MTPATVETRLGLLEQKSAAMEERLRGDREAIEERLRPINRSIDRVIPYGESIIEVRGIVNGALDDVRELRENIAALRATVAQNETNRVAADDQRRSDRRSDRKLLWGIFGGLASATIAAVGGIVAAGIHP